MAERRGSRCSPTRPPERIELAAGARWCAGRPIERPAAVAAINESLEHLSPWMAWATEPATEAGIGDVLRRRRGAVGPAARLRLLDRRRADERGRRWLRPARAARRARPRDRLLGARRPHRAGPRHRGEPRRSPTPPSPSPGSSGCGSSATTSNVRSARVPEKLGYALQGVDGARRTGPARVGRRRSGWSTGPTGSRAARGRLVAFAGWTTARSGCSTAASAGSPSPGR